MVERTCSPQSDMDRFIWSIYDIGSAGDSAAEIIRASASNADGLVEIARNPVDSRYLARSSSVECYSLAEVIGREFTDWSLLVEEWYRAPYERLEGTLGIEMIKYLDGLFLD